ncbi:ABC transporter substrate-binding protein [Lysinibacter sp. HNR]|uniref:ABC transporter substrate-binding protein n=1 Tax=Lysinibacter sp. HNR TaxID=3031408 RepID=UPI002435D54B|nr:ABC transporter substrate-binding protein [Lysinibacter sp. HNR]WGD37325.1 ABC transporter substrate-binding protein [Lysinibacter sp. HNR]
MKKWVLRSAILTTVAAVTVALSGCAGSDAPPEGGGTLTLANSRDLASYDTGELDTGVHVLYWQPVYDTLLKFTPEGEITPNMATSYEYDEGRTKLTLTLRPGITFSDGAEFNAEAVKANIEHLQSGTGVSVYMVKNVSDVTVLDAQTVEISLSAPDPAFTYYLCLVAGAMASPDALDNEDLAANPVGSGPYVLDKTQTIIGSQYAYSRNPSYWNAEAYPYDSIVVKPMEDLTARVNALKSGQINGAVADSTILEEAESSGLNLSRNPITWQGFMIFDRVGETIPALADLRVRQAINYAIDKKSALEKIFLGAGYTSTQIFNNQSEAYVADLDDDYDYDPARARQLMVEAGYADGFDVTMPEYPGVNVFPFISQQLEEIGIRVTWDKITGDQIAPKIMGGEYPMAYFGGSSGQPWRDIQKMVDVEGAWNPGKTVTPELTELMAAAQAAEEDSQPAAYQAVSRYLVDNAWFGVWLYSDNIFLLDSQTSVVEQPGSIVPYIQNFTPAK